MEGTLLDFGRGRCLGRQESRHRNLVQSLRYGGTSQSG